MFKLKEYNRGFIVMEFEDNMEMATEDLMRMQNIMLSPYKKFYE